MASWAKTNRWTIRGWYNMTIDLLALANQIAETKIEVELSCGPVTVYHIPAPQIWLSYKLDSPPPEEPTVKMKLTTGRIQERSIKRGDEGYSDWLKQEADYEADRLELQVAASYVETLKDIEYPDISQPPPSAIKKYQDNWPENETLRKKLWLDCTIMANTADVEIINNARNKMMGIADLTEDMVDEVKKNSASTTKGKKSASNGQGTRKVQLP